ncbi:MAG TPA: hypothetical protein ENF75_06990, partial [Acidilobales archaeon]|nr:hypothetical protein [Acidilobales archaeon]
MTSFKELVSKRLRNRVTYSPLDVYVDEVFRHKGIINLATGSPSTSLMPLKELSDAVREVVDSCSNEAFTYPPPLGIEELRHELKTFAKELGVNVEGYDLIIGAGALHIIDLIGKVLLDENDCVIVEEPTYIEAIMPLKF